MFKQMMIGLLGISVVAMLGANAFAATCVLRSSSGTCKMWSGSVVGDPIVTDSQGGVNNHPMINFLIHPTGDGVCVCGNSGKKTKASPGIQVVFPVDLSPAPPNENNFNFAASVAITRDDIENGVASVFVEAALNDAQKNALGTYCPNTGWSILDCVPCTAVVTITLSNENGPIDGAVFDCSLPTCSTLQWIDEEQPTRDHFEKEPYTCTLVSTF